jgi:hypothetical protein
MTKTLKWLCLAVMIVALAVPGAAMAKTFKIGVSVIVAHPALDADQKGFEQALKDAGIDAKYDYPRQSPGNLRATTSTWFTALPPQPPRPSSRLLPKPRWFIHLSPIRSMRAWLKPWAPPAAT